MIFAIHKKYFLVALLMCIHYVCLHIWEVWLYAIFHRGYNLQ